LRGVLTDAVRSRLRAHGTVWALLSGGLDSSSVVCVSDRLIQAGEASARSLETLSWVSDSSPESDERRFISVVEQQRGRQGHHLVTERMIDVWQEETAWISPNMPSGVLLETYRLVRRNCGRLLLTGDAGDVVMGNYIEIPSAVAALIEGKQFVAAAREARRRALATKRTIWDILAGALTCLAPPSAQATNRIREALARNQARSSPLAEGAADAYLIKPAFFPWWREELIRRTTRLAQYPDVSKRPVVEALDKWAESRGLEGPPEFSGVVRSHPYLHRPLVDFALGVPIEIWCPAGSPRQLMRTALRDVVPNTVLRRFSKGYPAPLLTRCMQQATTDWASRTDSLRVVSSGYVDRERLRAKLEAVRNGACRNLGNLPSVLKLERWLEARDIESVRTAS